MGDSRKASEALTDGLSTGRGTVSVRLLEFPTNP